MLSGWVAQLLQLASGFILPRLISDRLGQGTLGVWDFGWAVVSYFVLLQGGIVSSVNRYVAKHRASGDSAGLNHSVNSVRVILNAIAFVIAVLSVLAAWILPSTMGEKLGGMTAEAAGVILLLGLTSAVQVQGAVFGGVITGCHRWTVHNAIKTSTTVISVVGSLVVIGLGGGIRTLAAIMLLAEIVMRVAQRVAALRVCPDLELSHRHFTWPMAREMMVFGGKSWVNVVSQMFTNQTASIIVASAYGTGALAMFARQRSLVRSISTVVQLNSMVLVPMVSAIEAGGSISAVRQLALSATRYAAYFCLPVLIFLLVLGSDLMELWMGAEYVSPLLLFIFAVTGLVEAINYPLYRLLMGMNRHGKLATLNLAAATCGALLALVSAAIPGGKIHWIAASIAVPSLFVNGLLLPAFSARLLDVRFVRLLRETLAAPLLCCLPGTICLIIVSNSYHAPCQHRLLAGACVAVLASGWPYWKFVVPGNLKQFLRRQRLVIKPNHSTKADITSISQTPIK